MKIGIDMDDVIVDFFPSFLRFYNQRYEKDFKFQDMTDYHIWKIGIGRDREEAITLVDEFYNSNEFSQIPFVNGARKGVEELARQNGDLIIITSRPIRFREKTQSFLEKHFRDIKFKIHYSSGLHEQGGTKADICKIEGVEIFLEDCLKYAEECVFNGISVLLLDKPWNQGSNGKAERVYNWDEILEKIRRKQ